MSGKVQRSTAETVSGKDQPTLSRTCFRSLHKIVKERARFTLVIFGSLLLAACSGGGGGGGLTNPGTPPPTDTISGTVMF